MRMKNNFLIYSAVLIICFIQVSADLFVNFEHFMDKCKRIYPPDEIELRKKIFENKRK